jgi:hypothetical protein
MQGVGDRGSEGEQWSESSWRLVSEVGLRFLCAALPFLIGTARSFALVAILRVKCGPAS